MKITQTGTYIPISAPTAPYLEIFTTDKPPVSGSKTPHHIPCGRYTQRRQSPAPACTRAKRTISGFTARIFREPPLAHTFPLLENFEDTPERRERDDAEKYRKHQPLHADGKRCGGDAEHEKHPPRTRTEPILRLDDERMEKSDDKKRKDADRQSGQAIFRKKGDDSLHFTQTLIPAAQRSRPVPH